MSNATRNRVRYPDAIGEVLFDRMRAIDSGSRFSDEKLSGLRARGFVNASGGLTPVGKQVLDMHRDLKTSQARVAEFQRDRRTALARVTGAKR